MKNIDGLGASSPRRLKGRLDQIDFNTIVIEVNVHKRLREQ